MDTSQRMNSAYSQCEQSFLEHSQWAQRFRPRHFHIKILVQNADVITTQLYFVDDEFLRYEPRTSRN